MRRSSRCVPAAGASAAKKPEVAACAEHDLKGAWRAKDADRDGLKNLAEYKRGTNPRKADSDKDGLKDGDELTSANDPLTPTPTTMASRTGPSTPASSPRSTATRSRSVSSTARSSPRRSTTAATTSPPRIPPADGWSDDELVDTTEGDWEEEADEDPTAEHSGDEDQVDLGDGDGSDACDFSDLDVGSVLTSAELETRGGVQYLVVVEVA